MAALDSFDVNNAVINLTREERSSRLCFLAIGAGNLAIVQSHYSVT